MNETDDIMARLRDLISTSEFAVDAAVGTIEAQAAHITRLEERCAAYKGQVEAGAAEIKEEGAENARLWAENQQLLDLHARQELRHVDAMAVEHARAEAAEREAAALKEEVGRLREALEKISYWIRHELPIPTYAATTMLGVVLTALQPKPQEPKL